MAYQYAREVFPTASILRLGMTWPLPEKMITLIYNWIKQGAKNN